MLTGQRTTEQIDNVRSNILLRQTLARWRAVHAHNLTLPNTADAHRQTHLKKVVLGKWIARLKAADLEKREVAFVTRSKEEQVSRCWTNWRNRLIKNRTQRWTRDMSAREKAFTARREERLASTALEVCLAFPEGDKADDRHGETIQGIELTEQSQIYTTRRD
jgi:protein SFI1